MAFAQSRRRAKRKSQYRSESLSSLGCPTSSAPCLFDEDFICRQQHCSSLDIRSTKFQQFSPQWCAWLNIQVCIDRFHRYYFRLVSSWFYPPHSVLLLSK